jgi:putative NADH-flavin reductase
MKLTLFGATGRTGKYLVEAALARGYYVTALARNPAKLALQSERLFTVEGDIQDPQKVSEALVGADVVISVLGPTNNQPTFEVSTGMANILAAMQAYGVRRLVVSSGAGVSDPNDAPRLVNHLIGALLKLTSRYVLEDMQRTVDLVQASDRDWTVVRVPMLTDDPKTGKVKVGYVGKGTGSRISRADMADFMLKQATDNTYLCLAPAISN